MLSVVRPPQSTFSPLYVYLKLSWLKPEDVPLSAHGCAALGGVGETYPKDRILRAMTSPALAVCAHATIGLAALSRGQEIYAN